MMPFASLMSSFIAASLSTQSGPECGLGEVKEVVETTGQKGTDTGGLSRALEAILSSIRTSALVPPISGPDLDTAKTLQTR